MIGREDEVRTYRDNIWIFRLVVILAWSILFSRLVYLQIIRGEDLRKFSEANRLKTEKLFPPRGVIYDRNGKVLVDNRASFDVVLVPQYFKFSPEKKDIVVKRLAKALQISKEALEDRLSKIGRVPSYSTILLKADVSKEVIAAIETDAEGFPGVDIEANVQRRYPFKDVAAQLLGYIREVGELELKNDDKKILEKGDYIGKFGLEKYFDSELRGVNGKGYVEVDASGRRRKVEGAEKVLGFVSQTDPLSGNNIHLTIDADLQNVAAAGLRTRGYNGSVVAIDPRSGEILALVNEPSFEPEKLSGREVDPKIWQDLSTNKDRPLRNRALQDFYPPGSTFKLFMAIAGLAEKKVKRSTAINCGGGMQFGNRRFSCWKRHGYTDFVKSIRESCDVFYYKLGDEIGIDMIAKYARLFGLGSASEIKAGLPSDNKIFQEQKGLIPDSEWKKQKYNDIWHPGETISVSIGQGYVSVTPMQMANAYAAIGNGGFLYRPFLVRKIETTKGSDSEIVFHPELKRKIDLPQEVFEAVKEGLFEVVNVPTGTGYMRARSKKVDISGKTGTAQVRGFTDIMSKSCPHMEKKDRHHGWFVGYAPRENPEIAVAVIAEHSCHGTEAAPIVREVIETYLKKQALEKGLPFEDKKQEKKLASPVSLPPSQLSEGEDQAPVIAEPVAKPPSETQEEDE